MSGRARVEALIFDFGGVISRTLFETHRETEAALGLAPGALRWRGPFAPETDPLWRRMQADEISEREYWRLRTVEVAELVGADWTEMSEFVRAARGAAPTEIIRPEFLETLDAAKAAGLRLAILSNELDLFYGADFRDKLPFLADFEVVHDATYTKTLKPASEAYRACLAALDSPADACLFIDDQARNVAGAEAVGLHTVHFDVRAPRDSYDRVRAIAGLREEAT